MKISVSIIALILVFGSALLSQKPDSLLKMAEIEYEHKNFSKTRDLCEQALLLNPNLGEAHNLIGKAYASSSEICGLEKESHRIKEEILWIAIDEWERAISKPNSKSAEAKKLITRYSSYLPTGEHFRNCFTGSNLDEGDEFFVECWIQRMTTVRFKMQ